MRLRDVEDTGTTWMSGYSENGVLIYSHIPDNEGKNVVKIRAILVQLGLMDR